MRQLIVSLLFISLCLTLAANYVKNQPYQLEQPDGTWYDAFVTGDEFYHNLHDENGYTILQHPQTGYYVYAIPDGNSIKASEYVVGTVDPGTLGIEPKLRHDETIRNSRRDRHYAALEGDTVRIPHTGTVNNIFVFVRFADQDEYTTSLSVYDGYCNNGANGNMNGYFLEVSNNQLTVNTTFYPAAEGGIVRSFQDSHNRNYYLPYSDTNTDGYTDEDEGYERLQTMFRAAIVSIAGSVPTGLNIDADSDDLVDNVTFVVQGGTSSLLWPLFWSLHLVSAVYINSKRVWHYNLQLSESIYPGVICHEMSHTLGFPDLYHYIDDYGYLAPVGSWDPMESQGWIPQHHLTYTKWKYGQWFATIPTIVPTTTAITYTLTAIDQNPYSCYKIESTQPNQFYMLEYRRKTGTYETSIPGSGLIVYRIISEYNGSPINNGNMHGPPDEVYIYRPGGTLDSNGIIDNANFSSTVGRTSIHTGSDPEPWLFIDINTVEDGNLVIFDVGESGDTTISFKVRTEVPFRHWTGEISTTWATPGNWSGGVVPDSDTDVIIPTGCPRYPVVTNAIAYCKNLYVTSGTTLTINNNSLYVAQETTFSGQLIMNHSDSKLYLEDDITWMAGATASITNSSAKILCQGSMTFNENSAIQLTMGTVEFYGSTWSFFYNHSYLTQLNNLSNNKVYPAVLAISTSTNDFTINGHFYNYNSRRTYNYYDGNVILKGNLIDYSTSNGIMWASGTLFMSGTNQSISFANPDNHLNHLRKTQTGTLTLNSDLTLKGELRLMNGTVNANGYDINMDSDLLVSGGVFNAGSGNINVAGNLEISQGTLNGDSSNISVGGNWTRSGSLSTFSAGTSKVIFNGSENSICYGETFNQVELNKQAAAELIIASTSVTTCNSYKMTDGTLTLNGGTFTALDVDGTAIVGTINISTWSTLNLHQNPSSYLDLNGTLNITSGELHLYGLYDSSYWPAGGTAAINMSGGTIDVHAAGILIYNTGTLNTNITGGTIRTAGSFVCQRSDFEPAGGTLELYSVTDSDLTMSQGSLYHLKIDKSSSRNELPTAGRTFVTDRDGNRHELTRSNTVTANANLTVRGNFLISSGVFVAPAEMSVYGNWNNNAGADGFVEGTGKVFFKGSTNSYCYSETFNALELAKTETAELRFLSGSNVTCSSYKRTMGVLRVNGGTLTALDLDGNYLLGTIIVSSGTANIYQDSSQLLDLRGHITVSGGTLNLYGSSGTLYWPNGLASSLTMSGSGIINIHDQGIHIRDIDDFPTNITGGTIRVAKNFICSRTDFNPTAGTLEMNKSSDALIIMNAGSLNHLKINKTGRETGEEPLRAYNVSSSTNFTIHGNLDILNGYFNPPPIFTIKGNWNNVIGPSAFIEGSGTVVFSGSGNSTTSNETFKNLEINKTGSAYLEISTGKTVICNSYLCPSGKLYVTGGTFNALSTPSNVIAGTMQLTAGEIHFYQATNDVVDICANITISGGTLFINGGMGTVYLPGMGNASLTMSGGVIDVLDIAISIVSGLTFTTNITGGTIRTARDFYCYRSDFNPTGSSILEMYSSTDAVISMSNGSLYNLNINKSSRDGDDRDRANTVTANTNLDINGSFTLQSGTFIAPAQMNVARHWTNNAGEAAFVEGTGTVVFDGILNGYVYNETFNILGLNKTSGTTHITSGNTITCNSYEWTAGSLHVQGGTFDVLTLTDGVIAGTFNVTAGALNFYRGSENYAYFRADATISGGGLYIRGGNITTFFGNGSSASLTMSGGVFDVTDMGISFQTAVPFVTNITGGTIRTSKNFACYRSDFNPSGGTLEMYSSIDANLYMSAGTLYNLKINKAARDEDRETTRANTATASSNLVINGDFILQSGSFVAPSVMNVRGNWNNIVGPAAFTEGTGTVIFDGESNSSILTQEAFNAVTLNKTAPSHLSIPAGANASCNTFSRTAGKLLVEGGIFSVLTLPDGVIAGVYEVTSGELNFHRGTANNAYFRADVTISDGGLYILGGTGYTFFGNGSSASLTMTGGVLDVTDMGISFQTAFPFVTSIDYGTIRTARNFYCYRADFNPYFAAIVEMYSSYDAEIHMSAGTLPQFYVNKSARDEDSGDYRSNLVTLTSDITSSSIRIDSGSLKINGHTAQVDGSIFVCGTLIMDNPADYLDILNLMVWEDGSYAQLTQGTISIDQSWKVMSGATVQIPAAVTTYFTGIDNSSAYVRKFLIQAENFHFGSLVFDGDDPDRTYTIDANSTHPLGVAGDLTITSNYTLIVSTIDIIVNGSLNLQGTLNIMETDVSVDEKANLAISSTLTIDTGAFSFHDSSSPTLTQLNGTLVINSGNFTAQNHTLSVTNTSNLTISGGYINCTGLYAAQANAFQPTGGTLTIMGNPSQSIMYMTVSNGNWLHNFNVETDSAVRLNATLQVNGNISIENGRLDLNSNTLNCNGDINVEYGILEVDAAASLSLTSLKTLNVWAGSRLELLGTSSYPATLTNSTGRTSVNIESGSTVAANYAIIEKIASPGFNVKPGALVDAANSFHNCTFFDSSANRALLVLDNNQNLAIFNATFPTNIWSGAYNVRKNVDTGLVNFVNASGGFAGESYDKDDFNRIFWTQNSVPAQPELQIVKAVWSDTNPGLGETTTLTVTYLNASTTAAGSNYLDLYYNRSTPPPWMLAGDQFVLLPSVPAGIPQEVSFDVTESFTPGSWNSWLLIDRNRNVGETDETNNAYGPVPITWNLVILQPVTNLTIEYLPAVNHMRLNWNYSTSVTRFKIYRSNDPNFTPSPANYLASVTYPAMSWTDTALGLKNFYIVTAEIEDAAAAAPVAVPTRQSVIPSRRNE
ncbi:MAG: hypothetical protein R6V77_08445 [Candidatus Cloacimonadaceae bacterium]